MNVEREARGSSLHFSHDPVLLSRPALVLITPLSDDRLCDEYRNEPINKGFALAIGYFNGVSRFSLCNRASAGASRFRCHAARTEHVVFLLKYIVAMPGAVHVLADRRCRCKQRKEKNTIMNSAQVLESGILSCKCECDDLFETCVERAHRQTYVR